MRIVLAFVALAVIASPAHAEGPLFGFAFGGRSIDLEGQIKSESKIDIGAGVIIAMPIASYLRIAFEPSLLRSGSEKYALRYLSLPILVHGRYPLAHRWAIRGTAGLAANVLVEANLLRATSEFEKHPPIDEHLRGWDPCVLVGAAIEHGGKFAELRYARGLATIHADDPGLFVVTQELGLWIGFLK